ncbi:gfo/Idh/MocA family oxidoreductase, partial [Vibrio sp. 1288]|nr:gfo/Idh/MocA family oxidoreductase [Vibrio sp. 1288]
QLKLGVIDEQMKQRSLTVAKVLTEVRKQTGVVFPADQ